MINKVEETIKKFRMLKYGDSVLVGLSGGADSVTLLSVLCSMREKLNLEIFAAHVNHGLRGKDSDADEAFVKAFCEKLGVPIYVLETNIKEIAKESGQGLEECGRNIRYGYFEKISKMLNSKVATAHTLSDNLETLILNFTRGSGLNGMCGIKPIRNNIIRPLICLTRSEIEAYCIKNNLKFVTDNSNYDRCYSRNKIRLDVIPVLKEINPSVEKSALRMIEQFSSLDSYVDSKAKAALEKCKLEDGSYSATDLLKLDRVILERCIKYIAGVNLENIHINLIIEKIQKGSGAVTLPSGKHIKVILGKVKILPKDTNYEEILWEYKIDNTKILTYNKREFIIKVITVDEYNNIVQKNRELSLYAFDYDAVDKDTVVRNRRPSDKFKIPKRNVTKTLKKLFNEEKIPVDKRNNLPIIANKDRILWIFGLGASEFACINNKTKKVLIVFPKECNYDK